MNDTDTKINEILRKFRLGTEALHSLEEFAGVYVEAHAALTALIREAQANELKLCIQDYMNENSYYEIEAKKRLAALNAEERRLEL